MQTVDVGQAWLPSRAELFELGLCLSKTSRTVGCPQQLWRHLAGVAATLRFCPDFCTFFLDASVVHLQVCCCHR